MVEEGRLSALQLETVLLASQRHATLLPPDGARGGFFIGDGAGVGKGRQLAGLIYENWMKGRRRHIWVSTSSDLRIDAARDLADVVGDDRIPVIELSQQYGPMPPEGVVFLTYSKLAAGRQGGAGHMRSRFDQLLAWATRRNKEAFDGCLLFDESHRAKALFVGSGAQSQAALVRLEFVMCRGLRTDHADDLLTHPIRLPIHPPPKTKRTARDASPGAAAQGARRLLLRHGRHGAAAPGVHEQAGALGARHDLPRRLRELPERRDAQRGRGDGGGCVW